MPRMMAVDVEFADTGFLQPLKIARRVILNKWIILKLNRFLNFEEMTPKHSYITIVKSELSSPDPPILKTTLYK